MIFNEIISNKNANLVKEELDYLKFLLDSEQEFVKIKLS